MFHYCDTRLSVFTLSVYKLSTYKITSSPNMQKTKRTKEIRKTTKYRHKLITSDNINNKSKQLQVINSNGQYCYIKQKTTANHLPCVDLLQQRNEKRNIAYLKKKKKSVVKTLSGFRITMITSMSNNAARFVCIYQQLRL